METKKCSKCGEVKAREDFRVDKKIKSGMSSWCIECLKADCRRHYAENREKLVEDKRRDRMENPEKEREAKKRHYQKHKEKHLQAAAEYREAHREELRSAARIYAAIHAVEKRKMEKARYQKAREDGTWDKEKANKKAYAYIKKHPEKRRAIVNKWSRNRRARDPLYTVLTRVRGAVRFAFEQAKLKKGKKSSEIIGCDAHTLLYHLESTFVSNYGILPEWDEFNLHIDHIVPISQAKTEDEILELSHFTNLQLLFADDNMHKHDKTGWTLWDCA